MEFSFFTNWGDLPDSAKELFDSGEKESLFFSRPWFETLANSALNDDQQILLACVIDRKQLLAILPLKKGNGDKAYSLTHNYSSFFSLLICNENQSEILNCLAQGLSQLPLQSITLMSVDPHDQNLMLFQATMETLGFECHQKFRFYNWFHRVKDEAFSTYMDNRPGKLRNTISRKQRKLEREHDYNIRLFRGEEVTPAMDDYYSVYKASWKAEEQFGNILNSLIHRFSSLDWTRLAVLYIEDQPVAAQIWFVVRKKASIFRLVYDKRWRDYSPGSILTRYLMEYVLDIDGVKEIDFLNGNEQYKQDWMSKRRERWSFTFINRNQSPQGRLRRMVTKAGKTLFKTR